MNVSENDLCKNCHGLGAEDYKGPGACYCERCNRTGHEDYARQIFLNDNLDKPKYRELRLALWNNQGNRDLWRELIDRARGVTGSIHGCNPSGLGSNPGEPTTSAMAAQSKPQRPPTPEEWQAIKMREQAHQSMRAIHKFVHPQYEVDVCICGESPYHPVHAEPTI